MNVDEPASSAAAAADAEPAVASTAAGGTSLETLGNVPLRISALLAQSQLSIEQLLSLKSGSVLPLPAGRVDSVELIVDGKPLASGEITSVNKHFCVRVCGFHDLTADELSQLTGSDS